RRPPARRGWPRSGRTRNGGSRSPSKVPRRRSRRRRQTAAEGLPARRWGKAYRESWGEGRSKWAVQEATDRKPVGGPGVTSVPRGRPAALLILTVGVDRQ